MLDPKTENKMNRRDKKNKKNRYGMQVSMAGRKLAEILQNITRKNNGNK